MPVMNLADAVSPETMQRDNFRSWGADVLVRPFLYCLSSNSYGAGVTARLMTKLYAMSKLFSDLAMNTPSLG